MLIECVFNKNIILLHNTLSKIFICEMIVELNIQSCHHFAKGVILVQIHSRVLHLIKVCIKKIIN